MSSDPFTDTTFRALATENRRRLLEYLRTNDPEEMVDVSTVVELVDWDEVDAVAVSLRHVHLPMLAEGGYIRWDEESNEVGRGRRFEDLVPILNLIPKPVSTAHGPSV